MQESASYEARNVMCNAVSLGLCLGSTKCRGDKFACMGGGGPWWVTNLPNCLLASIPWLGTGQNIDTLLILGGYVTYSFSLSIINWMKPVYSCPDLKTR